MPGVWEVGEVETYTHILRCNREEMTYETTDSDRGAVRGDGGASYSTTNEKFRLSWIWDPCSIIDESKPWGSDPELKGQVTMTTQRVDGSLDNGPLDYNATFTDSTVTWEHGFSYMADLGLWQVKNCESIHLYSDGSCRAMDFPCPDDLFRAKG